MPRGLGLREPLGERRQGELPSSTPSGLPPRPHTARGPPTAMGGCMPTGFQAASLDWTARGASEALGRPEGPQCLDGQRQVEG